MTLYLGGLYGPSMESDRLVDLAEAVRVEIVCAMRPPDARGGREPNLAAAHRAICEILANARGGMDASDVTPEGRREGWSLADREGIRHLPLRENDEDAWWTPVACGGGINLPGSQTRESVTCVDCLNTR